jgi:hypothetical protein
MEKFKMNFLMTLAITGYFLMMIMGNYTLVSYYSTKYDHSETAVVKNVYINKSKRSSTGRINLKMLNEQQVTSDVSIGSVQFFSPGLVVNIDVYKNLFGDKYYVEKRYGHLNLWGPTLGFILDGITLLLGYLVISSNRDHRKKVGAENVRRIDREFKIQILIASLISLMSIIIYLIIRP